MVSGPVRMLNGIRAQLKSITLIENLLKSLKIIIKINQEFLKI